MERVESFVLATARATGVTGLPLQKIVAAFRNLGGAGKEVDAETVQSVESAETNNVDAPHRRRGGSKTKASSNGDVRVSVKFGNGVKGDDRRHLLEADLRWNGKYGRWIGVVAAATVVTLRNRFPNRFALGWPSRAGVKTAPHDTAVGDLTTTDMPMPVETVPAAGIGRAAPHTPPVDQVETTTDGRAGGAVTGGAEAASDDAKDNAGDTSKALAPVQPPVAAKSPAPPPAPRFPNFPRGGARG